MWTCEATVSISVANSSRRSRTLRELGCWYKKR